MSAATRSQPLSEMRRACPGTGTALPRPCPVAGKRNVPVRTSPCHSEMTMWESSGCRRNQTRSRRGASPSAHPEYRPGPSVRRSGLSTLGEAGPGPAATRPTESSNVAPGDRAAACSPARRPKKGAVTEADAAGVVVGRQTGGGPADGVETRDADGRSLSSAAPSGSVTRPPSVNVA